MKIDFSAYTAWKRCPKFFDLHYIQKYQPLNESLALTFGTLAHSFLAKYHLLTAPITDFSSLEHEVEFLSELKSQPHSTENPILNIFNDLKRQATICNLPHSERYSIAHLLKLCLEYVRTYPKPQSDFRIPQKTVELSVDMPIRIGLKTHIFHGTIDILAEDDYGPLIIEHKTAGRLWDFAQKASLSFQKVGYCVLAQHLGYEVDRVIYNGLKTSYGPRDKTLEHSPEKNFKRLILDVPKWEIEQWWNSLLRDIPRIVEDVEQNSFSMTKPEGCLSYGSCPFRDVCNSSPETGNNILDTYFTKDFEWKGFSKEDK